MAKEPEINDDVINEAGETPSTAAPNKAAPSAGMFVVIAIGFVIMISTPLITYFVVKGTVTKAQSENILEESKPQKKEKTPPPPRPTPETVVDVEPVVVNIDGTQGTRYLKLAVQLVTSDSKLADELRANLRTLVKDRVITSAGNKSIGDLEGERGRETLRRELIQRLNNEFAGNMSGVIVDVYYSEYLIQ